MLCLFVGTVAFSQETEKEVFLIVSRPQFREGLQSFVQWKRQEGFDVVELYVDTNSCFMVITDILKNPPVFSSRGFCGRHNSNEQQYDLGRGAFLFSYIIISY